MAGLLTTNPQPTSPRARQTARTETYRLQLYRAMQATGLAIAWALAAQAEVIFGDNHAWPHTERSGGICPSDLMSGRVGDMPDVHR